VAPGLIWTLIAQVASTSEFYESTLPRTFEMSYGYVSCVEIWTYYVAPFLFYYYTRLLTPLGQLHLSSYCGLDTFVMDMFFRSSITNSESNFFSRFISSSPPIL
jgi:hypothetical protein